jgi:23S rRNA pseudouridine955/2504/2580 synthase
MFKPSFCFRLDKDTSGVLIAAKQYEALQYLNKQIKERHIVKRYIVVVQ